VSCGLDDLPYDVVGSVADLLGVEASISRSHESTVLCYNDTCHIQTHIVNKNNGHRQFLGLYTTLST